MARHLGPEAARNLARRCREGFFEKYLSGNAILDIGFRGADLESQPITEKAIGVDLDYPGYDGRTLPFPDESQDAVFASHVLEHVTDWAVAIGDWYRVLKVGGYMVIAVPHRDLYERKATLPSIFNPDHKRFYTPASLLAEIEQALPVGGYRVRSIKDVDEGFDYTSPPEKHATGCYEIELVLERIRPPSYVQCLRPAPGSEELTEVFGALVHRALRIQEQNRIDELKQIQVILSRLPLPPFYLLEKKLQQFDCLRNGEHTSRSALQRLLAPVLACQPFDDEWYLTAYPDVASAIALNAAISPKTHFIDHGYFEGRYSRAVEPLFK